jgi:hypothetical protein
MEKEEMNKKEREKRCKKRLETHRFSWKDCGDVLLSFRSPPEETGL